MPIVRRSKKRDAMLRLMQGTTCHPTADWIYRGMREEFPDISLGTVYRNLNQLCEERLVMRVGVVDGHERFDADVTPHAHFFCSRCGEVSDLPDNASTQTYVKTLSKQYGFVVHSHEFKLHGLCKDCENNKTIN
jgi:Fur family peroxide stress response transcriptional regulator